MLLRFAVGLVKGCIAGALLGYPLVAQGLAMPPAVAAYPAALALAVVSAEIAGTKPWEPAGRIQVMIKGVIGVVLAPLLLLLARTLLTIPLPLAALRIFPPVARLVGDAHGLTVGGFAMTSLALVGAVLAGLFDADDRRR